MAVGYFSKALRRAGPLPSAAHAMPARPAEPLSSPLAEVDQRLNLDSDFVAAAPAADPAEPDAARAPPPSRARETARSGQGLPPADQMRASSTPSDTPSDAQARPAPKSGPVGDDASQTEPRRTSQVRASQAATDPNPTHPPLSETALQSPARTPQARKDMSDATVGPDPPDSRSAAETALERMTRAINIAERWVAQEPEPPADLAEAAALSSSTEPRPHAEIAPVLQNQPDFQNNVVAAPPPRVAIGRIEVEVVPPPAPPAAKPAPRSASAKPGPRPPAPFGWRQR